MVMPLAGRVVAAVVGGLLVLASGTSVIRDADRVPLGPQPADTVGGPGGRLGLTGWRRREPPITGGATGCSPPRRQRSC